MSSLICLTSSKQGAAGPTWIWRAIVSLLFVLYVVVTIYVRKEEEKAYNALMLDSLTLEDLKKTVVLLPRAI